MRPKVQFPGQEDPLEKEMATHSSLHGWRMSWTEEPGGLVHSVARVGHDLATKPPAGIFNPPCSVKGGWGCPKWATCKSLMSGITLRSKLLQHGTLLSVMWQPGWEASLGRMDTCVYMAEFLCCHLKLSQYCLLALPNTKLKVKKKKRIKPLQVLTCSGDI